MTRPGTGFPYGRALAFLRTRLLGAVVMPACIGAAWTARGGSVRLLPLALVLAGLAAAELLDLFGADYALWRAAAAGRGYHPGQAILPGRQVILPGSPVIHPSRLRPERLPAVLLPLGLLGLAVLLYFALTVGIEVLIFLGAAVAVGGLYALSPFPYAFLATAVLPPLISGGTHLALSGRTEAAAFWAGLPVAWISLGVILGYRVVFVGSGMRGASRSGPRDVPRRGHVRSRREGVLLGVYGLAGANVAVWVFLGLLPRAGLLSLAPWAGCLAWLSVVLGRKPAREKAIPATAIGVVMHTLTAAALALALWLG